MQAYRAEIIVPQDGELRLNQLPFHPGEMVEIIILSRRTEQSGEQAFVLKDTVVKYEAPTDPAAADDWAMLQ